MKRGTDYFEAALREDDRRQGQRAWLDEIISRLTGSLVFIRRESQYWNHPKLPPIFRSQGYSVCCQTKDHYGFPLYIMISRSHTTKLLGLDDLLDELRSSEMVIPFKNFGEYFSRSRAVRHGVKVGPGTYATIKFGEWWYMISQSGFQKPYFRLTSARLPTGHDVQDLNFNFDEIRAKIMAVKKRK
jgi:hypothetical protein